MPNRKELEIRAASAGVVAVNYPNDSKLEQAVIYAEKNRAASSTSTTYAPAQSSKDGMSGGANV